MLNTLPIEERKRLEGLFDRLDCNKDGRIDVNDLAAALHEFKPEVAAGERRDHAEKILTAIDSDDGELDFAEFVKYVTDHEKKLRLVFDSLDHDSNGKLTAQEIRLSLRRLGLKVDEAEALRLVKRVDKDGTLQIDFNEFRQYFFLHHSSNIHDIVHYWRHSTVFDLGENSLVPDDFTRDELVTSLWWRTLVAGGVAGMVSRTATAPLDRIKVLLQVHGHSKQITIRSGFQHMLKEGGWQSLWRGNGINVLKIAPESALKFMAYEQVKYLISADSGSEVRVVERLVAGSCAGLFAQSVIYPMEVIKTRLCLRKTGQYSGIWDCARKILQREGVRSFYRGYVPNAIGIIPYAGIDLAVYETLKKLYRSRVQNVDPPIAVILACGATSSTCGQLASYPLALVRTKLQAKAVQGNAADSMLGMFRSILRDEGLKGLYRGLVPNFLKVIPAVSISYVLYEHVRRALGVKAL